MKKRFLILLLICWTHTDAQQFITAGTIEFESRKAVRKSMDYGDEDDAFWKDLVSKLPQFTTNYFTYTFANNQSLYKFARNADVQKLPTWFQENYDDDVYFNDYGKGTFLKRIAVRNDDTYLVEGEQPKMEWKISPNENTVIAGFNCRKASTVLFDSVYVFAYYTDEISISGGPMNFNGLPGMILGITVPRLHTSWVATTVSLKSENAAVTPPSKGKKITEPKLKDIFLGFRKNWGKDQQKYINPTYWRTFL
ncbi:GLPGLI family protein [Niabella drilacis]|uniref:GLPGLI family protein n=1 Tax=Niabella drilacis (strain DSM 25811 / CCM 8410 / CCUG 62505 / LMG 26954 / E90) TaxID=1285928 RepID=A0A1G6LPW3_NIADE|nr:GLPGLI family protein [Niabella drilacis]SDC45229.1 GLPGLI family protein [Niabella drilacis]